MALINDGHRIGPVLFSQDRIAERVAKLADEIDESYQNCGPLMVVGVQKGAAFFVADLVRRIRLPLLLGYTTVSSYGLKVLQSDGPQVMQDSDLPPEGHHVLIVEDIIDTGRTLEMLRRRLSDRGAASVEIAVLLDLQGRAVNRAIEPRFRGFSSKAQWVCGFGIDYKERYRNLPDIHVIENATA